MRRVGPLARHERVATAAVAGGDGDRAAARAAAIRLWWRGRAARRGRVGGKEGRGDAGEAAIRRGRLGGRRRRRRAGRIVGPIERTRVAAAPGGAGGRAGKTASGAEVAGRTSIHGIGGRRRRVRGLRRSDLALTRNTRPLHEKGGRLGGIESTPRERNLADRALGLGHANVRLAGGRRRQVRLARTARRVSLGAVRLAGIASGSGGRRGRSGRRGSGRIGILSLGLGLERDLDTANVDSRRLGARATHNHARAIVFGVGGSGSGRSFDRGSSSSRGSSDGLLLSGMLGFDLAVGISGDGGRNSNGGHGGRCFSSKR